MTIKEKLVPVKFDTPEDLCKALLDGREFLWDDQYVLYSSGCQFYYYSKFDGQQQLALANHSTLSECVSKYSLVEIIEEEVHWWDSLGTDVWEYATPLTKKEVLSMLYKGA